MGAYLLQRLIHSGILLLLVCAVVFGIIHAAPGGPAILLNPEIDPEQAKAMAQHLGLDEPIPVQFVRWLGGLAQGKLGLSFQHQLPVTGLIAERLPATVLLTTASLLIAVTLAIPLGIISALKRHTWLDYAATLLASLGVAAPPFWLGIMLIVVFAVELGWLPTGGMRVLGEPETPLTLLRHLTLPAIVLATFTMAQLARYTRSSLLGALAQDYIRTARGKGVAEPLVIMRHALRNALIPVVTVLGVALPRLIGGAAITESVFAWPGMGSLAVSSAFTRDYPVVMGITLMMAVIVLISNLVTDLMYVYLDPRVKLK